MPARWGYIFEPVVLSDHASVCGIPDLAKLAYLAHNVDMSTDLTELSVSQARDHFSDAVNRAAFGGEITYITRGRNQQRAAAIVPAKLVEQYEAMYRPRRRSDRSRAAGRPRGRPYGGDPSR